MKLERKVIGKIKLGSAIILVKTGQTYLFGTEGAEVLEVNGDEPGLEEWTEATLKECRREIHGDRVITLQRYRESPRKQ